MVKISNNELLELARIYNEKGKRAMYALLADEYGISNPSCVFKRMCKKTELAYDAENNIFFSSQKAVKTEDIFMSMDELCTNTSMQPALTSTGYEHNHTEAMEMLIRELINDRLLSLRKYVTMDCSSRTMYVDKSSLKQDGYHLQIH